MDLPKIIKIAREHTLLGCYETSLKKYQVALEIIQARKKEVNARILRDKWQMTELNIKSEIGQTKQMLDACRALTNIDFNYFKKQIESDEIKKKKFQEKGIMVFDMSSGSRGVGPNQNYFGSAPFSFNDPSKEDPFKAFQNDQINGIMVDSMNSDVNEDDEKILNPLKPQRNFGKNKKSHKKKLGSIASINVVKNNNGQPKSNPWFDKDKSKNNNLKKNNSYKTDEKSMINPLEQFDISNSNLGGLDISVNSNNVTMDKDTTFMKEIKSFVDKNKRNSYAANAQKRKSMKNVNKNNNANNTSNTSSTSNTISYPTGVGNYSNKNKIINFDKKLANKGALPVIMKKENDKIINSSKQTNYGNNNDISGVDMIDQALKNFNMDNDESSILDTSNIKKWLK
jgi:hypothetical protein